MESELERIERRRHRLLTEPKPLGQCKGWRRWLRRPKRFRRDPSRLEISAQRSDCVLMEQIGHRKMLIYSLDRQRTVIRKLRPLNVWEKLSRMRGAIMKRLRRHPKRERILKRRSALWRGVALSRPSSAVSV